jgi:hypothetical protein
VKHRANPKFWRYYQQLSPEIQKLADENFALLKSNPRHRATISAAPKIRRRHLAVRPAYQKTQTQIELSLHIR